MANSLLCFEKINKIGQVGLYIYESYIWAMKSKILFYSIISSFLLFSVTACNNAQNTAKPVEEAQGGNKINPVDHNVAKLVGAAEMMRLYREEGYKIIDIRTPEEIAEGKVPNATELDFYSPNFAEQIGKLNRKEGYVVYCRSGGRSKKATDQMIQDMGFTKVCDVRGGYGAYKAFAANQDK